MSEFKKGDRVVCIDAPFYQSILCNGVKYTVEAVGPKFVYLEEMSGKGWLPYRFELVKESPKVEAPFMVKDCTLDNSGGLKFDGGKPRWSLLMRGCAKGLAGVVDVLMFGAQKYAADSWQAVPQARERYTEALYRHLDAVARNGFTARDPETGKLEWFHIATNALFLATFAALDAETEPAKA